MGGNTLKRPTTNDATIGFFGISWMSHPKIIDMNRSPKKLESFYKGVCNVESIELGHIFGGVRRDRRGNDRVHMGGEPERGPSGQERHQIAPQTQDEDLCEQVVV
jgi:hypothetical protein